jgi:hypothetical protein
MSPGNQTSIELMIRRFVYSSNKHGEELWGQKHMRRLAVNTLKEDERLALFSFRRI